MARKNPVTKSYIWTVIVLQLGHEEFCQRWLGEACVQIEDAAGSKSFVPLVSCLDPDLTVHEDMDQILLAENLGSQVVKRKQKFPQSSQQSSNEGHISFSEGNKNANLTMQPIVLDPEEVSQTFSDIQAESYEPEEPICSAIVGSQVNGIFMASSW